VYGKYIRIIKVDENEMAILTAQAREKAATKEEESKQEEKKIGCNIEDIGSIFSYLAEKASMPFKHEEEKKEDEVPPSKDEGDGLRGLEKRNDTPFSFLSNRQQGERRGNLFCNDGENDTDDKSSQEILMNLSLMKQAQIIEDGLLADLQALTNGLAPQLQSLEEEKLACKIHHLEEQFVLMVREIKEKNQQSKDKISTLEERIDTLTSQTLVGKQLHHKSNVAYFWKMICDITFYIFLQFPFEILKRSIIPWFFSLSVLIVVFSFFLCPPQLPQVENIPGIL